MWWDGRSYVCGSPSITSDAGVQIGILFTQLHLTVNEQHLSRRWTEVWLVSVGKVIRAAVEFHSWQKQMTLILFFKYLFFVVVRFTQKCLARRWRACHHDKFWEKFSLKCRLTIASLDLKCCYAVRSLYSVSLKRYIAECNLPWIAVMGLQLTTCGALFWYPVVSPSSHAEVMETIGRRGSPRLCCTCRISMQTLVVPLCRPTSSGSDKQPHH